MSGIDELLELHPFLAVVPTEHEDVIGIIQNVTNQVVHIYDLGAVPGPLRIKFLEMGAEWWFESNTKIPADVFLGDSFDVFSQVLRGIPKKAITNEILGHQVNLAEEFSKRTKKRRFELMREPVDTKKKRRRKSS